jgi:predicted aminopeptidase
MALPLAALALGSNPVGWGFLAVGGVIYGGKKYYDHCQEKEIKAEKKRQKDANKVTQSRVTASDNKRRSDGSEYRKF